ncbi:MAG: 16S rRNA (uracil(1498)-N(3))-methyltransferase [Proteobacteria bacterium]|nr:16S rRNA (uracil(1498)-N(3))-methyltransferase [Pseudomonadota bacterium]
MTDSDLRYEGGKVRLHVEGPLRAGETVLLEDGQAHYLLRVMRAKPGDRVSLFNGSDGEWLARVAGVAKRSCTLACERQTVPQTSVPDLWLCFAPIKKTPADYVVQKATELGVRVLQPVFTRRTIVTRVNLERMRANAVEAAEQSDRLDVPECRAPLGFDKLLAQWPKDRTLIFCDEGGAPSFAEAALPDGPAAIFTGPEGGFDPAEREALRALSFVTPVSLGPRILRADTAALAALTLWQSIRGDWR